MYKLDFMASTPAVRFDKTRKNKTFTRQFGKITDDDWINSSPTILSSYRFWECGDQIYYSAGTDQYIFDTENRIFIKRETDQNYFIYGSDVWSDENHIYYSSGTTQYIFNKNTDRWENKTWSGLTDFSGRYVWTDGVDVYYSYYNSQFILNKNTSTWTTKTWEPAIYCGDRVWTDGENTYYSDDGDQYILDKTTNTWSAQTWNGSVTSFSGTKIYNLNNEVYLLSSNTLYRLDKNNNKFVSLKLSMSNQVAFKNKDKLYSYDDYAREFEEFSPEKNSLVHWNLCTREEGEKANNIFELNGSYYFSSVNCARYKWNDESTNWTLCMIETLTWPSDIIGRNVWRDENNYFCSTNNNHFQYNSDTNTWDKVKFSGMTKFNGENIWTDGMNIYLYEKGQYQLDKKNLTWLPICLSSSALDSAQTFFDGQNFRGCRLGLTLIYSQAEKQWKYAPDILLTDSRYCWYWNNEVYYSEDDKQYKWDASINNWVDISWTVQTTNSAGEAVILPLKISGTSVWATKSRVYYQYTTTMAYTWTGEGTTWTEIKFKTPAPTVRGKTIWFDGNVARYDSESIHWALDEETLTWNEQTIDNWPMENNKLSGSAEDRIWTDGTDFYWSLNFIYDKENKKWIDKIWTNTPSPFYNEMVWTDGIDTYYSNHTDQYILDKTNNTWNEINWTGGLTSFRGDYIWTDGLNTYYSHYSSQYVLDNNSKEWVSNSWSGLQSFEGDEIWTDGIDIYYSENTSHYILDKETKKWSTKTWEGDLTNSEPFYGRRVWTDGVDTYYSHGSTQLVLEKETSKWKTQAWANLTSFYGNDVWSDGENVYYYSSSDSQYLLDKETKTWTEFKIPVPVVRFFPILHNGVYYGRANDDVWYYWTPSALTWTKYGFWDDAPKDNMEYADRTGDSVYLFDWWNTLYTLSDSSDRWIKQTDLTMPNLEKNNGVSRFIWYDGKTWFDQGSYANSTTYWDSDTKTWKDKGLVTNSSYYFSASRLWSDGINLYGTTINNSQHARWCPLDDTFVRVHFSENRDILDYQNIYIINNRIFYKYIDEIWELMTNLDFDEMDFYCDDEWLHYIREDIAAVPKAITSATDMDSLLANAPNGGIYQYVGDTTPAYTKDAYYLVTSSQTGESIFQKMLKSDAT